MILVTGVEQLHVPIPSSHWNDKSISGLNVNYQYVLYLFTTSSFIRVQAQLPTVLRFCGMEIIYSLG